MGKEAFFLENREIASKKIPNAIVMPKACHHIAPCAPFVRSFVQFLAFPFVQKTTQTVHAPHLCTTTGGEGHLSTEISRGETLNRLCFDAPGETGPFLIGSTASAQIRVQKAFYHI